MYLKQIELQGFKSFANKTTLDFSGSTKGRNSITAIVGPNGSGKSNISDAIRWVMGEQSMKQIRGKKSEDVIFSGSDSKGKLGLASVSLVLDNTDGRVPMEHEEIVISRRIYRSGESEYLINGAQVRLLDLQILLAKAQFANSSYSVIGQGTIDRLLLQSPQERKSFFDEATGIKEFQIKRHQSWLKMNRTHEHIDQAELLLQEVSPRLRTLSRQVKKLEARQEIEIELREGQETYYTTLYNYNQGQIDVLRASLASISVEYTKTNKELTSVQEELAGLARETTRQEVFQVLQTTYQEILHKKNEMERRRAVLQGKMQAEYSKAGKQNIGWLEQKITSLKEQEEIVNKELADAEGAVGRTSTDMLSQKQKIEEFSIERAQLRGKIAQLQHQSTQAKSEQTFFHLTGLRAVQAILENRHQFGSVYGAVAQLGRVPKRFQVAMDVAAGSHLASLVVGDDTVGQACIQFLRNEQLGTATFLPLNKIKPRAIPHDIEQYLGLSGVHGLAIDLLDFDKKFDDIFSYILGGTLVVDDIDTAREIGIGRVRMVTLDGDVLETSGSMKGGHRRRQQNHLSFTHTSEASLFSSAGEDFEQELQELQQRFDMLEIAYETAQEVLRDFQSQAQITASKATIAGNRKESLDTEIATLSQELSLYTMKPEEYDVVMKEIEEEKHVLDGEIVAVEKDLQEADHAIAMFNKEEEEKKQRIFALQDAMQTAQETLNAIVAQKNEKEVSMAKLETKQEDLIQEAFQELHTSLEAIVGKHVPLAPIDSLDELQTQIQKLKYKLSLIGGIDDEVIAEYKETKERHEELTNQLDDLNKAMKDLEQLIEELDGIMKKRRGKAFKQIRKEFARYFSILFDGGKADLVELYGYEDEVEGESQEEELEGDEQLKKKRQVKVLSGIDVVASPPGKKIGNIAVLSGGERTMTSIALVCAILHTNPSPFVVLDEVEAALDEANSLRFTKILGELSEQSQFILITHNRATMHVADELYGVTMGNDGMSQLVSVSFGDVEEK